MSQPITTQEAVAAFNEAMTTSGVSDNITYWNYLRAIRVFTDNLPHEFTGSFDHEICTECKKSFSEGVHFSNIEVADCA